MAIQQNEINKDCLCYGSQSRDDESKENSQTSLYNKSFSDKVQDYFIVICLLFTYLSINFYVISHYRYAVHGG